MEQVFNAEMSGLLGATEIKHDKGVQVIEMMNARGKKVKITSENPDQEVATLRFGQEVLFRLEGITMCMNEYGNLMFKADSVRLMKETKNLKAVNA